MLLFLIACSGDVADTSTEETPDSVDACVSAWADQITAPDEAGPDTQIHGTSVFDGENVWVAWSLPNDFNTFDIWMARYGCDGALQLGPMTVTDGPDNELDPSLAVSGDRLLMAWTSSTTHSSNNLDIRYQVFDLAGAPVSDAGDLQAERAGVVVTGNATLPRVASRADGFVLAGSWGHDDAPAFQAFSVLLDRDGNVIGDAADAELDVEHSQTAVDVAMHGESVVLAWQEDSTSSTSPVSWWSDGGVVAKLGEPAARPTLTVAAEGVWAAWDSDDGTVWLQPPLGEAVALSLPGFSHSPRLSAAGDTVVLLTMSIEDGIYNSLHLSTVDESGVVATLPLDTVGTPSVYGVDVTLIDQSHALVVWQDGENPAFRLRAQWLTLSL